MAKKQTSIYLVLDGDADAPSAYKTFNEAKDDSSDSDQIIEVVKIWDVRDEVRVVPKSLSSEIRKEESIW